MMMLKEHPQYNILTSIMNIGKEKKASTSKLAGGIEKKTICNLKTSAKSRSKYL